jgi:two-component system, cell cycle response regulator
MRILLAEPSRIGRKIVADMLAGDGHEIVASGDADEVLAFMRGGADFDVLITAIEFATISGFELCWEAKLCRGDANPVYVIVLSSSRDELKLVEALDSGADDYLTKPPRPSELLARLRAAGRLLAAQNDLVRLASYDSLTNLRNRRSFFEVLEKQSLSPLPFSIIMLDVDHFKQINDRYGHDVGDEVLREIGRRGAALDRQFSRLGGEEFGLIVPAPLRLAGERAEHLRGTIAETPFKTAAGPLVVTASIGVAECAPGMRFEETMREADVALYASKSGGRNRVTLSRAADEAAILHFHVAKAG